MEPLEASRESWGGIWLALIVSPKIVLTTLLLIREDLVRFIDFLEHLLSLLLLLFTRALVSVRVPLLREAPISLLDLIVTCLLVNTENLVVVFAAFGMRQGLLCLPNLLRQAVVSV